MVATLWNEAAKWLAEKGSDQWQYPVRMNAIRYKIEEGTCWLVISSTGGVVGTVTLDENADPQLWTPADLPNDALYVHRLVVSRQTAVPSLGAAVLDWCAGCSENQGKQWLRLDAWTSNVGLHDYYRRRGFEMVRIVHGEGIVSGALFQRPAMYREGISGIVVTGRSRAEARRTI